MYHDNHPARNYEMANKVVAFGRPHAVAWQLGQDISGLKPFAGGRVWRYDIRGAGWSEADVMLTYDWSAVPPDLRKHIQFPPFDPIHLENSLSHLSELAAARR
jgi:hypothetical protein